MLSAAHREIGVGDAGIEGIQHDREPIGEAVHASGVVAVPQTLGLAVAQCDIPPVAAGEFTLSHDRDCSSRWVSPVTARSG